jgi:hypothetical protein
LENAWWTASLTTRTRRSDEITLVQAYVASEQYAVLTNCVATHRGKEDVEEEEVVLSDVDKAGRVELHCR